MTTFPTGTVTLLFTDIEGSTALLQRLGPRFSDVLTQYRALLRSIFQAHDGHEVDTQGDSFFVAFPRAMDAVQAAVALQRALAAHPWPEGVTMATRMGLHTGEPQRGSEGYVGIDVHRAARIGAAGHGGQVLLSEATRGLVAHDMPHDVSLRDLGEHRFKDLQHAERIFQLAIAGLPSDFPPLKTLNTRATNLPLQPTSFIGREQEVAAARQRLLDPGVRLLTLTGPGGIGKTRLALQVAGELLDAFVDGVWLVELAPAHDPVLVTAAIAAALGVKESATQPVNECLKVFLHDKHVLLLLDNFEQVLAAAPLVAELLRAASSLKVLVTSRAPLHLRGEREVAVPPLSLPLLTNLPGLAALEQVTAVCLFAERARDARADFALTAANAAVVANICVRLDGLPLAIELAAARSKMLAPQALLARLQNHLKLLTGGAQDLPTRQQTLRGTIDWSFGLLDANEQRLFVRLAVFVGGWTVEAAEAVCNGDGDLGLDVLDGLQSLLDKSLLRLVEDADGEPRFRRLETIREYAVEQLAASGEAEVLRDRHLTFFLQYVEVCAAQDVPARFGIEQDNLRAALGWALEGRNVVLGARLLHATAAYSIGHGHTMEWRAWLERALLSQELLPPLLRAHMLFLATKAAAWQGQTDSATVTRLWESRALFQVAGDTAGEADAL